MQLLGSFFYLRPKHLNMKRILPVVLCGLFLSIFTSGLQAQNKIGYISIQELIVAMPEYKKAEADLNDFGKALNEQFGDIQKDYNRKDSIYNVDSTKWTQAVRDVKRKELNELRIKVYTFQQEANQSLQKREQDLLTPIQQKAVATAQAVAKENGYAYILPKEQLIHFPQGDDIFPLVAKKLGLKLETPTAATTAPKPTGN